MKKWYRWILPLFVALLCLNVQAQTQTQTQTPSDASIRQLLQVSNAQGALANSQDMQKDMLTQLTQQLQVISPQLNNKQRAILDQMVNDLAALIGKYTSWERLEPVMLSIYQQVYTQEEVDALIAFYSSPTGQSVAQKIPQLTSLTTQVMQEQMMEMIPELQRIQSSAMQAMESAQ
ncbi:hypothetical protein CUZ56_00094 [Saezia sanguinis]|uniref:DUF2059 domain-containing protein n=2 Tax=Saezia sanguinis TaxID=1965230 RepID=A0A433SFS7_9BURK|nr:hypothetical protein CUZ56_00094 [Saezia sanguinis]